LELKCQIEDLSNFWQKTQQEVEQGIELIITLNSQKGGPHGLQMVANSDTQSWY
jgi:hypothetical protein